MDQDLVDRIRSASFSLARKGYDKREVDAFLDDLADWFETSAPGGAEDAHGPDPLRRELERIGEQTTAILTEAHDAAETMRAGAERQVRQQLADANIKADTLRSSAEEYAEEVREEADAYARRVRAEADATAERARIEADTDAQEVRSELEAEVSRIRQDAEEYAKRLRSQAETTIAEAREKGERSAKQILDDATRRRGEVEKVIADLEQRREAIVGELRRLASAAGIGTDDRPRPESRAPTPASEERTRPLPVSGE
ncbi:MAG TPA: DivIVA domain-containing protein [Solirubrobacterales bacterium]|nr:DivIVA domain-containing protein [Solirubrobacterales bacterium]